MARGPKGEYRPNDPIKNAHVVMKIAVGEMTEDDARKLAPKKRAPKPGKSRAASKSRVEK